MTESVRTGKWISGLHGDTPCVVAAERLLRRRLRAVDQLLAMAAAQPDGDPEWVHQLRVASRRSDIALRSFAAYCEDRGLRRLRKRLRQLRRTAAGARQNEVRFQLISQEADRGEEEHRPVCDFVVSELLRRGAGFRETISAMARAHKPLGQKSRIRQLLRPAMRALKHGGADTNGVSTPARPYTLGGLAAVKLPGLLAAVQENLGKDLIDPAELHTLRIAGKKLRYGLEVFAGCFPARLKDELYPQMEQMLEHLGEINDLHEVVTCLEEIAPCPEVADLGRNGSGATCDAGRFAELLQRFRKAYECRYRQFVFWWESSSASQLMIDLAEMVGAHAARPAALRLPPVVELQSTPEDSNRCGLRLLGAKVLSHSHLDHRESSHPTEREAFLVHRRVAAIDVGTNSIRLVVGEADPLTKFRVIEDLKETTRLGDGVFTGSRMSDEAMEMTVRAIERMKAVAEACRVDRIRAVATSAVREAANRSEFLDWVEQRTGIRLEVINAEHEARLAFSSVSNSFELDDRRVAVVDIGGGSTELVLSSGGVIDEIHPLPLGAVRLTELYDRSADGKHSFEDVQKAIDGVIRDRLGSSSYRPYLLIGTGGTFTSLARVAIRHGTPIHATGRFSFAVRGYEMRHSEVRFVLDMLRRMPLDERRRVPGLSSRRAEIIVAGVCIVERLMQCFGVDRVRVHDGGIRDGLLAEMIDELGFQPEAPRRHVGGSLETIRRFAERNRYEKPHSEHVAFLALRLFDQLVEHHRDAAATWGGSEGRHLLHAAAVLHDVGLRIGFKRHHKHSYDMVTHADLPGFSRREVQIIANLCRYHRGGGPKAAHANFQRLGDDDQRLVTHLVGILRIADGLDRLHLQDVLDVTVTPGPKRTVFDIVAPYEPAIHLRFARRKAHVFEQAFQTRARFVWTSSVESDVEEVVA